MKALLLLCVLFYTLFAQTPTEDELKKMIGHMLIVGFEDKRIDKTSQIVQDMKKYELGGVILFDKFYKDRSKTKNIYSPKQLQKLTSDLKKFSTFPLFISVDQEGGKVARLKEKYGFSKTPSAFKVSKMSYEETLKTYEMQSSMLKRSGINMNFAPVVDLAINPNNKVIVKLERSYGKDMRQVSAYAKVVIAQQNAFNVISVLKHFPGHGSSLGDSHQGFVDISETWSPDELTPYYTLINDNLVDVIMTAHVFNSHIDATYPATLSYKFNTKLLRDMMEFKGVIISDDLQMGAISKHYTLKQRVALAINSGVDILLFGNQLESMSVKEIVDAIFEQVKSGVISYERIEESNLRIRNLHTKNSIIQKPISFTQKRITLTKKYIHKHYGFKVEDITIKPKIVVLHWTAVMGLEKSFQRLEPEVLLSDRKDIVSASALNVSAHFLVDRDGTIYQMMPENFMARHVIGLNYSSIGIENVGGKANKKEDLTLAQLDANVKLIKYLKAKYPSIEHIIGHYEYREFEKTPLWLEKDDAYRTKKADPGEKFITQIRSLLNE